jgi:hypothetical protein
MDAPLETNETSSDYLSALVAAHDELERVLKQRADLDKRMLELKKTIEGLAALCDVEPWADAIERDAAAAADASRSGITQAIRRALSESKVPLSPTEIRSALIAQGISMARYANEMVVIHNTLNRLVKQNEVVRVQNPSGQIVAYTLRKGTGTAGASGMRG